MTKLEILYAIEAETNGMDDAAALAWMEDIKEAIELRIIVMMDGELPGPNAPEPVPEELKLEE